MWQKALLGGGGGALGGGQKPRSILSVGVGVTAAPSSPPASSEPVCRPEPDQRLSFPAQASLQPAGARTRSGAVLQCAGDASASRCFAVLQALTTLTEQSNMALCVESLPVSPGESTL